MIIFCICYTKYIIKIKIYFLFFNVATRKFKWTHEACIIFLLSSASLECEEIPSLWVSEWEMIPGHKFHTSWHSLPLLGVDWIDPLGPEELFPVPTPINVEAAWEYVLRRNTIPWLSREVCPELLTWTYLLTQEEFSIHLKASWAEASKAVD